MAFRRDLTFFDVTNITVGAIVGADIYVASAITAGLLGPASILAWVAAGVLATILALNLAECARLVPSVGGPYAYVSTAFGRFPGFLAGWSMWIAELTALPVFAIAFTNYLGAFAQLGDVETHVVRITFLAVLTAINVWSVRTAGRVNDALTLLKLAPLLVMVVAGFGYAALHPAEVVDRFTPFAPFGFAHFTESLVLIVWAYAGFELSTVPAGEVAHADRTIPRALAAGMGIVTLFYLSTNLVVYALVPHEELARSAVPLAAAGTVLFGGLGATLMSAGAMVSVSGSDESDMLGSSRLAYAMAADGLLPHPLASLHARFGTPWVALIVQSAIAAALTFVNRIPTLIGFAVVNLALSFLLCALALLVLRRRDHAQHSLPRRGLPVLGVLVAGGLLLASSPSQQLTGAAVIAVGTAIYWLAPRRTLPHAIEPMLDPERVLARLARRRMRFLGGLVGWFGGHRTPARSRRRRSV
ncbi:MAG: APC family permease [Dehalococcoidia bacterium]